MKTVHTRKLIVFDEVGCFMRGLLFHTLKKTPKVINIFTIYSFVLSVYPRHVCPHVDLQKNEKISL